MPDPWALPGQPGTPPTTPAPPAAETPAFAPPSPTAQPSTGQLGVLPVPSAPAGPVTGGATPPSPSTGPAVSSPSGSSAQPAAATGTPDLRQSMEIQGNVLAGFRKDHQVFAFLRLPDDPARARGWLGELVPRLAATREVAAFNARFSAARRQNGGDDPESLESKWVNVGLTAAGLRRFGSTRIASDLGMFGPSFPAFMAGAASRAAQLGDTADSDPSGWLVGAPAQPAADAVLTVAADDPDDLLVEMEKLRALATKYGVVTLFEQRGNTLPGGRAGHEHFGFKDGVSQPGVAGFDAPATDQGRTGEVAGSPGTKLVAPGEFVLGHPREGGAPPWPCPGWMRDGAFQVWRRLEQDVPGFWAQATAQLASSPSDDPPTEDWLAAKLMGRWRSGTPLDAAPDADNRSARDPDADNDFDFTGRAADGSPAPTGSVPDSAGLRCPLDAHVRKMNPRNGAESPRRIIRRGVPFGLPFDPAGGRGHGVDADRGLLFMAFMASIENQFEFLQSAWANTGFPGSGAGPDPVIGAPAPPVAGQPTHHIQRAGQPPIALTLRRFVRTTGAVYAFAPSLPTLRSLAGGTL